MFSEMKDLILGGDMNFTISNHEIWAPNTRSNPLADYFDILLHDYHLIDILPAKMNPTWSNRRIGEGRVMNRLDCFLTNEILVEQNINIRQWLESRGESVHSPICMEIIGDSTKPTNPFKLCVSW